MVLDTIVLCPGLAGPTAYDRDDLARALSSLGQGLGVVVVAARTGGPDGAAGAQAYWVANVAVGLSRDSTRGPVLLVLGGRTGSLAPALGLSQRAARRQVGGYVLVDAACPATGPDTADWPDAPVGYLASPAADPGAVQHARLRGWRVVPVPDLAAKTLAAALRALITPTG